MGAWSNLRLEKISSTLEGREAWLEDPRNRSTGLVGVGPLYRGGMISTSESEGIETHLLFRWKAASRMIEVGVDIPWPLIVKSETSCCLLTNLISRKVSYMDVFRNIFSLDLDCGNLFNVHLNGWPNPSSSLQWLIFFRKRVVTRRWRRHVTRHKQDKPTKFISIGPK